MDRSVEQRYDAQDLERAVKTVLEGGLILYPTDTIWGIGCDATNDQAVSKVFELKQRADSKALITLMEHSGWLERYMPEVPEMAYDLVDLSTEPLTIIYTNVNGVSSLLKAEDGSVAVRIPNDAFCKALCNRIKRPLVSTSANISGDKAPACFDDISDEIKTGVDYVVNFRQQDRKPCSASKIIKLDIDGAIQIIRG
ncbi:MAG: L-threonylcarbamoyladenylate synthase [Porphyromonas sp.]|nr:L-threonylcarbamoyladenylate synthase [Porphyromonas sp.]